MDEDDTFLRRWLAVMFRALVTVICIAAALGASALIIQMLSHFMSSKAAGLLFSTLVSFLAVTALMAEHGDD